MTEAIYEPDLKLNRFALLAGLIGITVVPMTLVARHSIIAALAMVACGLAAVAFLSWRARHARIVLDDGQLAIHGAYGTKRIARADIATVALVPKLIGAGNGRDTELLLLDGTGHRRARLLAPYWGRATQQQVADRLGGPTWVADRPMSHSDLAKEFPHAIGYADRNPTLAAILLMTGVFALIFAAALLYGFVLTGD